MRHPRPGLILLVVAALILAACGSSTPSSVAHDVPTPTPSAAAATPGGQGGSPGPTSEPTPTAGPSGGPTATPAASPTAAPSSGPSAGASPGDLAACSGTDANRDFFAQSAAAFTWDVYCPSLPSGWFVESGSFRGASGGYLVISYKTSAGLRFELKEGNFCSGSPAECSPMDSSLGSGSFADLTGEVGRLSGSYVLYVAPGTLPAYQATGAGIDEATFRAFCAALVKVPG